jgi:hypothetical protein
MCELKKISFFNIHSNTEHASQYYQPHWLSSACHYSGLKKNFAGQVTSIFWVLLIKTRPQHSDNQVSSIPSHCSNLFTYTHTMLRYSSDGTKQNSNRTNKTNILNFGTPRNRTFLEKINVPTVTECFRASAGFPHNAFTYMLKAVKRQLLMS